MNKNQEQITDALASALTAGTLTVDRLRQGFRDIVEESSGKCQDVLYLQCRGSTPASQVIGMMRIKDGQCTDAPIDPEEWPYQTVLEAVRDGWRIISFPNMALVAVPESQPVGLGFEFILERWS